MRRVYELDKRDIIPTTLEVLAWQKIPEGSSSVRIKRLADEAIGIFQDIAQPIGLVEDFDADEFPGLYNGNGLNAADGPVPSIAARAKATALMAATMGDAVALKCKEFMTQGKASISYMLNAVCAVGADRLGCKMCRVFRERLLSENGETPDIKVQYYSPGHCGWHISGQEKLFAALHPDEIGMSLDAHFIMYPFKSISGILAAGLMEIHRFNNDFSFCAHCRSYKCAERIRQLENE